jgi:hypothetical protein
VWIHNLIAKTWVGIKSRFVADGQVQAQAQANGPVSRCLNGAALGCVMVLRLSTEMGMEYFGLSVRY